MASLSHMLTITQLVISITPAMNYATHPLKRISYDLLVLPCLVYTAAVLKTAAETFITLRWISMGRGDMILARCSH